MADILFTESDQRHTGVGLLLDKLCKLLAVASGVALLVMALLSLRSIVGRIFFDSAFLGDYELVQMLSAIAVAMALPSANALMDMVAHLLLALFSGVLAWRLGVGMVDLKGNHDASMMLNIPTWWSYAPMVPSFALLAATSLHTAAGNLRKLLP